MADNDRREEPPQRDPFGPPPDGAGRPDGDAPLGIGRWSYGDDAPTQPQPAQPAPPPRTGPEPTQVLPAQPGPSYWSSPGPGSGAPVPGGGSPASAGGSPSYFPAPAGVPPLQPPPPPMSGMPATASAFGSPAAPPERPRRARAGAGLLLAATLLALVVGGAAGYGGSRLAAGSDPISPALTAPSAAPTAPSSPFTPQAGQADTVAVAREVLPSTVMIQVGSESGTGSTGSTGSGFVLDQQGHIMTNNHVVAAAAGGQPIRVVYADGTRTTAKLVGRSPSYDLAVIRVAASPELKPIRLGNSDQSQVGEPVIAVGAPLGLPGTVTAGIVSAKNRPVVVNNSENADAPSAYINGIQTDAPINPGNSGGPLIDSQARVIGVNSAILTLGQAQGQSGSIGLGFAIPINQARQIGSLLIRDGKATYPVIGASVGDEADGVQLTSVDVTAPAYRAGLRQGDVVTTIDGQRVAEVQELIVAIRTHRPGDRVRIGYSRDGDERETVVTLGSKEG